MLEIVRIPVLTDNYVWLAHDPSSNTSAVIDPAVADPVLAAANERGWHIDQILNTHWHPDHVGGNAGIVAATGAVVTGPRAEADRIPHITHRVAEGDMVAIGSARARVLDVPAHTAGHIAYAFDDAGVLFPGDTIFAMGCGRLFEGTADQMLTALGKFMRMPATTRVYCAHEYTAANARFAMTVEPDNAALQQRVAAIVAMRARGEATVPFTLGEEAATNPFVRARNVAELAARRQAKDAFRG